MDAVEEALKALEDGDDERALMLLKRSIAPEPLPCPCCGGSPDLCVMGLLVYVQCHECGLRTLADDIKVAIGVWNKRHADKTE